MRAFAAVASLAFSFLCPAQPMEPPQSRAAGIVLYDAITPGHALLPDATPGPMPPDVSAFAQLTVKMEPRTLLSSTVLQTGALRGSAVSGWRIDNGIAAWVRDRARTDEFAALALAPEAGTPTRSVAEYDELWADVGTVAPIAPCAVQVALALDTPDRGHGVIARSGAAFATKTLSTLEPSRSSWMPKDVWYLAGRALGANGDDVWRYTSAGPLAVLQRRLNLSLDGVEAIDVALAPGIRPQQVNLRIGEGGLFGASEVLEFADLHAASGLPDKRPGFRLNVRQALEARRMRLRHASSGTDELRLQEIVIFVAGDARLAVESAAIRRIDLLAAATPDLAAHGDSRQVSLPSKVVGFPNGDQRLVVDLRPLRNEGSTRWVDGVLQVVPPQSGPCAVRLRDLRLVKPYTDTVPAFAAGITNAGKRWGDAAAGNPETHGHVPYSRPIAYLAMSSFSAVPPPGDAAEYVVRVQPDRQAQLQRIPITPAPGPYRVVGDDGKSVMPDSTRMVASNGATVTFAGAMPAASANEGIATWEGFFRSFEVAWPLNAYFPESAWFHFGVPGGAEHIARLMLSFDLADGRTIVRDLQPNRAEQLELGTTAVRRMRLRAFMRASAGNGPAKLSLEGLAVFEPTQIDYNEAFVATLPAPTLVSPPPHFAAQEQPTIHEGHITGLLARFADHDVEFTTPLDPPFTTLRGLRLKYGFPPDLLNQDPCPVRLRVGDSSAAQARRLCFDMPAGEVFVPFAALGIRSLDELRAVHWTIRTTAASGKALNAAFDIAIALDGWTMMSTWDRLRTSPLANAGGRPVFLAPDASLVSIPSTGSVVKLPLEPTPLWRAWQTGRDVLPNQAAAFSIDKIILATPMTPSPAMTTPVASASPPARRLLSGASVALAAAAVWFVLVRKRFATKAARAIRPFIARSLGLAARVARRVDPRALRYTGATAGLILAFLAIGISGKLGWGFSGVMLAIAAALALVGAASHAARARDSVVFQAQPQLRMAALVTGVGCAAWSLGAYGFSKPVLWGLLPLLAATYACGPWVAWAASTIFRAKHKHGFISAAWAVVAIVLYRFGADRQGGGENYVFTFAGIAVVLTWRSLALWVRPLAHRTFTFAATRIYGSAGGIYFCGALAAVLAAAAAMLAGRQALLEQLATLLYYFMVIAVAHQAWATRSANRTAGGKDAADPAG